jgi:hypothetical protein
VKAIFSTIICVLLASACSSKPTQIDDVADTAKLGDDKVVYNTEEPTSYGEYRQWRKQNDPASEAYADYREWQINYRKWKLKQEQL